MLHTILAMPPPTTSDTWTTRRLLGWMTQRFESLALDAPRVVAEMLLAHVLGCDRLRLYMEANRPASQDELARLRTLVKRACDHEPVQYLVGTASFFSRDFLVDDSTLIPQPCTEELVARILDWWSQQSNARGLSSPGSPPGDDDRPAALQDSPGPRIADLGTGSGCIAITLALQIPDATIIATDLSGRALDLARRNAERFGVEQRIELLEGALLDPLRGEQDRFDVICSNPPYISDREWESVEVEESVRRYVPQSATRGGADGLDFIRPIITGSVSLLKNPGLLAVEIGHQQREAVLAVAAGAPGLRSAEVVKDPEGHWRLLLAETAV